MSTKMPLHLLCLLVLAGAFVVAGCGDSDGGNGGGNASNRDGNASATTGEGGAPGAEEPVVTTSSLSKEKFLQRANAVCSSARQAIPGRIVAYQKDAPANLDPTEERAEGVKKAILPVLEDEVAEIGGLGAPAGDEEKVEEILTAQLAAIDEVASKQRLGLKEDDWEKFFNEANEMMKEYGLDSCTVE